MKKNILFIIPGIKKTGPITGVINILKNLDRENYTIHIISLKNPSCEYQFEIFKAITQNLKIYRFSKWLLFFHILKIRKYIHFYSINVVYSTGIIPDFINGFFLPKHLNKVTTVRNIPIEDLRMQYGHILGGIMTSIWIKIFNRINHVVGHSKTICDYLNENKVSYPKLIYNGSDCYEIYKYKSYRENIRQMFSFSETDIVIGHVGHHNYRKNIEIILRALALVDKKFRFVSFGTGPLTNYFTNVAKELFIEDRVTWAGFKNEIYKYYWAFDIFILPSFSEGLSRALIDSYSASLPVIVSNIPSSIEIVEDGINGYVFDKYDVNSLVDNINKLKSNELRKKIGCTNLNEARKKYNSIKMSKMYEEIFSNDE